MPKSDFQSQFFMSKIIGIFLIFFFIEEYVSIYSAVFLKLNYSAI